MPFLLAGVAGIFGLGFLTDQVGQLVGRDGGIGQGQAVAGGVTLFLAGIGAYAIYKEMRK